MPQRLNADIDDDLHSRLKAYCAERKISISDYLREVVEKTLSMKKRTLMVVTPRRTKNVTADKETMEKVNKMIELSKEYSK